MKFWKVDINVIDVDWTKVSWKEFQETYNHSLKGNVTESPEEIAKALGVKVPLPDKAKSGNA